MPSSDSAQQPNIYQRNGVYWGYFRCAGRRYRRSLRTIHAAEAKERFEAWRQEIERRDRFGLVQAPTYMEALLRWRKEVLPKAVKPAVQKRYESSMRQLDPHLRSLRVDEISKRVIGQVISSRSNAGATNATIRRDLTALSRLLSACVAWGWIEENHARFFDRSIIRERRPPIRPPHRDDVARVIAAAPPGMAAVLQLLDQTGMRENEAVTLERGSIDWRARQITLLETKTNRPRTLPWRTPAGDAGHVLADLAGGSGFLFLSESGQPYRNFSSNFGRVITAVAKSEKEAGRSFRRFRVHDLRHGFAIRWLKAGGSIYDLSRHLGHTSVKTTEIYLGHLTGDEQHRARGGHDAPAAPREIA